MFGTFSAESNALSAQHQVGSPEADKSRSKRHQVSRACAWCRTYRIKCDANFPCRNCKVKGRQCSADRGKGDVRTFPHAIKEIDRLKDRVSELEEMLKKLNVDVHKDELQPVQPPRSAESLPVNLDPWAQHGANKKYYNWDVVSTPSSKSQLTYGPSSSIYFIGKLSSYLEVEIADVHFPASRSASSSPSNSCRGGCVPNPAIGLIKEEDLSRNQEESILETYWHTYHPVLPILDRRDFDMYYNSLWSAKKALREASTLADIMLALCIQYQVALPSSELREQTDSSSGNVDASTAGKWWHRRGQQALIDQLEEPSICTFQCQLLSAIWLSNAGMRNMAHNMMANGIRTGIIMGLHLEPPEHLPEEAREFSKRNWWTMYAMEMKFAMELGRPLAVNFSQVTCSLPKDQACAGESESPETVSFNAHHTKLFLAGRAIYVTFYGKCGEVLRGSGQKTLYQDPAVFEECARFLSSKMVYLRTWMQQIPENLQHRRKDNGEPFSTDRCDLDISSLDDTIQKRRCIILELCYHNLAMSLHRPFIAFSTSSKSNSTVTEEHAISCVNHAITLTSMIHQLLTESDYLDGSMDSFQWQWNAALSLIGYILSYPVGPVSHVARKTLDTAMTVLDIQSSYLPGAINAATMTRDLVSKIDVSVSRRQSSLLLGNSSTLDVASSQAEQNDPKIDDLNFAFDDPSQSGLLPSLGEGAMGGFESTLANSLGLNLTSDAFSGFEHLGADGETMFDFLDFGGTEGL